MPARARGYGGAYWRRALALSFALHGAGLALVGIGARNRPLPAFDGWLSPDEVMPPAETPMVVDLAAADMVLTPDLPVPPPADVPSPSVTGPHADRTNQVTAARPQPVDGVASARAPAADRGAGPGRTLADPAWRRDASTLHERLADGAHQNQPSRARVASTTTTPQPVRRETATGTGDSTRSARAGQAAPAPSYGVVAPNDQGTGADTREQPGDADTTAAPVVPAPATVAATTGPLDTERGARSYDVKVPGAVATDNTAQRAASNEPRPSITDLSLSTVSGDGREGRGPSDTPGAVAHRSAGAAAAARGVLATTPGVSDEQRTQERIYSRYYQEIRSRVDRALVTPRALVVRLEQGESILRFVVRPDGHLVDNAVQVVKSSGFEEFDRAALDAVRVSLPFPPMPAKGRAHPLPVSLRVTISNPVIR